MGRSTPQQQLGDWADHHDSNNNKRFRKQVSYDFGQHDNSSSTFAPPSMEMTVSNLFPKVKRSPRVGGRFDEVVFNNKNDRINIIVNNLNVSSSNNLDETDSLRRTPTPTVPILVSATNDHIYTNVIYNEEKRTASPNKLLNHSPRHSKPNTDPSVNKGVHVMHGVFCFYYLQDFTLSYILYIEVKEPAFGA